MGIKWDRCIENEETGAIVLQIKKLIELFGWSIRLHKIIQPDELGQFHSHPAVAIRVIIKGGYTEQYYKGLGHLKGHDSVGFVQRNPGYIGFVFPETVHRIADLNYGPSYSIWIRGPIRSKVQLIGYGWPEHLRGKWV